MGAGFNPAVWGRKVKHALIVVALGWSAGAGAHLMPAGQGTLNVVGPLVYVVVSLPADAFLGVDQNHDQGLDAAELNLHQSQVRSQFRQGLQLQSSTPARLDAAEAGVTQATGATARWVEVLPSLPSSDHGNTPSRELIFLAVAQFDSPPATLQVTSRLWGQGATPLRLQASVSEGAQTLVEEVGLISAAQPSYTFFVPAQAVFASFFKHGVKHILSGPDHVMFLLALLSAGLRLPRWLWLLSAFTLAHGLTFAAASLGWVAPPALWVESLIAASIVLVAALSLAGVRLRISVETPLVFALGLVHGLGFVSALGSAPSAQRGWGIVGFNLGIEAAQLLVALLLYGATRLLPSSRVWQTDTSRLLAWLALAFGLLALWA